MTKSWVNCKNKLLKQTASQEQLLQLLFNLVFQKLSWETVHRLFYFILFFSPCVVILIIFVFFYSLHLTHIVNTLSIPSSLRWACISNTHSSGRLLLFSDLLLCELYKVRRRCALVYGSSILLLGHLRLCGFCSSHVHFLIVPPVLARIVLLCL